MKACFSSSKDSSPFFFYPHNAYTYTAHALTERSLGLQRDKSIRSADQKEFIPRDIKKMYLFYRKEKLFVGQLYSFKVWDFVAFKKLKKRSKGLLSLKGPSP